MLKQKSNTFSKQQLTQWGPQNCRLKSRKLDLNPRTKHVLVITQG